MNNSLVDILKDSRPFKGLGKLADRVSDKVCETTIGNELSLFAGSVSSQFRVLGNNYSLDDIFRDPQHFADSGVRAIGSVVVDKSHDFDLRFSLDRFAEHISNSLDLSFVGAYAITDSVKKSVETDRESGNLVPDRKTSFDPGFLDLTSPLMTEESQGSRLTVPFFYRGEKYGAAVFEKPYLSKRDMITLVYCCSQFSRHLMNSKTGYEWREAALTDSLTGLKNRRSFEHTCTRRIKQSQKSGNPFSMLLIDLDRFKSINDTLGHEAGDLVLKDVADVMRVHFRESDMFRYGGEEFAVSLPDTPYGVAHERARNFGIKLNEIPNLKKISGTIGVASTDRDCVGEMKNDDENAEDLLGYLLKVADERLYDAKPFRNAVCCIDRDSLTGFPNITTIARDDLVKKLDPAKRASGNSAIFCFNVSGMTKAIRDYGPDYCWSVFKDSVVSLNGKNSEFDSIARVHTRDEVIAYYCSDSYSNDFRQVVEMKARNSLDLLDKCQEGGVFDPLEFVLGVTIYNPDDVEKSLAVEISKNPYILLEFAQRVVDDLKEYPGEKCLIRKYHA
ncbi:GGDEF domain-containing protein [Candidatus Woesearchaeota archaeon]|nr:GGDEF domain-containing protein [Candidatus Woesearchaeota archaeon]